jgi:hypothetical protein
MFQMVSGRQPRLMSRTFGGVLEGAIIDGAKNLGLQQEIPEAGSGGGNVASCLLNASSGGLVLLRQSKTPPTVSYRGAAKISKLLSSKGAQALHTTGKRPKDAAQPTMSTMLSPCRSRTHNGEGPRRPLSRTHACSRARERAHSRRPPQALPFERTQKRWPGDSGFVLRARARRS